MRHALDQRGGILPLFVVYYAAAIVMLGMTWDWLRVQIHWRQLATAADAAARAAAAEAQPYTRLEVTKWRLECSTDQQGQVTCTRVYRTVVLQDWERQLLPDGWRLRAGCGGSWVCDRPPVVTDRWVQFDDPDRARRIAREVFDANIVPAGSPPPFAARILQTELVERQRGPGAPPGSVLVKVRATGTTQFSLMRLAGRYYQDYYRCSQSTVFSRSGGSQSVSVEPCQ